MPDRAVAVAIQYKRSIAVRDRCEVCPTPNAQHHLISLTVASSGDLSGPLNTDNTERNEYRTMKRGIDIFFELPMTIDERR